MRSMLEEDYEAPSEMKLEWITWLEKLVEFALETYDAELLSAVTGDKHYLVERLLYKRLRYNVKAAHQSNVTKLEGLIEESESKLNFVRAVNSGIKRKFRARVLAELSYVRLLAWKS